MGHSTISLGLGLGGGKSGTSSGRLPGGAFPNTYSVDFDGTDEFLLINSSYDLGTLSLWFNKDTVISKSTSPKAIVGFTGVSPYGGYGGVITGTNAGAVSDELLTLYTGDRVYSYTSSSATISADWHHLAVRWSGSDYEIYLDGVQVKNADAYFGGVSPTPAKSILSVTGFDVAARQASPSYSGDRHFDGLIDEVAIWSTPLSASDTIALYNSGVPSDISSLSPNGWWRMGDNDGGTGTNITDQGSGSNDGTLTNGPAFSTNVPT